MKRSWGAGWVCVCGCVCLWGGAEKRRLWEKIELGRRDNSPNAPQLEMENEMEIGRLEWGRGVCKEESGKEDDENGSLEKRRFRMQKVGIFIWQSEGYAERHSRKAQSFGGAEKSVELFRPRDGGNTGTSPYFADVRKC